jgi:hypothetical protein
MSALGITFVALALSWLIGRISVSIPEWRPVTYACAMISFVAMVTGIVLVGMML